MFLVSGNGGNLQFVFLAIKKFNLPFEIQAVVADRNCNALIFAKKNNIPSYLISYSINHEIELKSLIQFHKPNLVITTFHKIIDEEILNHFSNTVFINLHYSLLPDFKKTIGMKAIEMAKAMNRKTIGATVHVVEKEVDEGKIIAQGKFEVDEWDNQNVDELKDIVFKMGCILLLNAILITIILDGNPENITIQLNKKNVVIENDLVYKIATDNELNDIFMLVKSI
ncbi:MAG: hypothetical protein RL065_1228 [Bacteroidota bacterium]